MTILRSVSYYSFLEQVLSPDYFGPQKAVDNVKVKY
jgi:hypothetical protein